MSSRHQTARKLRLMEADKAAKKKAAKGKKKSDKKDDKGE